MLSKFTSLSNISIQFVAVLFVSAPAKLCEQGEIDENAIVSLETFNVTAVKNTGDGKAYVSNWFYDLFNYFFMSPY